VQVITNLPDDHVEHVRALNFPGRLDDGYDVPFSKVCYIESSDFREQDARDYYGLAPGKSVMLRCAASSLVHGCPCRILCLLHRLQSSGI
jgi:glutaminyl-tRNA synthetase